MTAGGCQLGAVLHGGLGLAPHWQGGEEPGDIPPFSSVRGGGALGQHFWRAVWQSLASTGDHSFGLALHSLADLGNRNFSRMGWAIFP